VTLGTYTDCRRRRHFLRWFIDGGELAQKMKFRRNQLFWKSRQDIKWVPKSATIGLDWKSANFGLASDSPCLPLRALDLRLHLPP